MKGNEIESGNKCLSEAQQQDSQHTEPRWLFPLLSVNRRADITFSLSKWVLLGRKRDAR